MRVDRGRLTSAALAGLGGLLMATSGLFVWCQAPVHGGAGLATLTGYGRIGGASALAGADMSSLLADGGLGPYRPGLIGTVTGLTILALGLILGLRRTFSAWGQRTCAALALLAASGGLAWGLWQLVRPWSAGIFPDPDTTVGLGPYLLTGSAILAGLAATRLLMWPTRPVVVRRHRGIQP